MVCPIIRGKVAQLLALDDGMEGWWAPHLSYYVLLVLFLHVQVHTEVEGAVAPVCGARGPGGLGPHCPEKL